MTRGLAPFPHWVIDGHWDDDLLDRVAAEFPPPDDPAWKRYDNDRERKLEGERLGGEAVADLLRYLASPWFAAFLTDLTGIAGLHCETWGGGLHQITRGGHLAVHADYNQSPQTGRWRRLNTLVFLNRGWERAWGGDLELWGPDGLAAVIAPIHNRTVIFATSETSWHGHPHPLACPPDRARRSVAAYYFTDDPAPGHAEAHSTVWKDTP